jgi:hypothetical protein
LRIDRPTRIAAALTLAAAAPVYFLLYGLAFALQQLLSLPEAGPPTSLPPVAARGAPVPEPEREPTPAAPEEPARPVAQVTGALRTQDGTPIRGEAVELESWALEASYFGASDARGRFSIPNVALGSDYEVRVLSEGRYRNYMRRGVAITVEGLRLDLVLEPLASARLAGRMVDAEGVPIPLRTLLLQSSHAPGLALQITGDDRGQFTVEDAPTGQLTFSTRTVPHLKVRGPVLTPASEVDLRLVLDEGSHELGGRVVGARDIPVAGAQLKLSWSYKQGGSVSSSARTAVTDPSGSFRFTDLGSGPHRLAVRADGYEDALETYGVFWNSGDVELRLRPIFR